MPPLLAAATWATSAVPRRRNRAIERALNEEVAMRLRALKPRCIYFPVPNGFWIPTRSVDERAIARRLVSQMKQHGMIHPGAFDWVFLWPPRCGAGIELKRPAIKTLLEKIPGGVMSDDQKTFKAWCIEIGVEYHVCDDWAQVLALLTEWGVA